MRDVKMKVANMVKDQEFTLYPYDGTDFIILQSDKRICRVNLRTGQGVINAKNVNYPCFITMQINPLKMQLPEDIKIKIQSFLWHNNGQEGNFKNVLSWDNKELFTINN
jgi:hypothetical protein